MNVFVVEDFAPVRERLVQMLATVPGAAVSGHAEGAADAIREILATQPDAVVLDLSLADGTGFDVLRAVFAEAPHIEVYVLSNFAVGPYRQLAGRLGARGFFDKSNEFDLVREAIAARANGANGASGASH